METPSLFHIFQIIVYNNAVFIYSVHEKYITINRKKSVGTGVTHILFIINRGKQSHSHQSNGTNLITKTSERDQPKQNTKQHK